MAKRNTYESYGQRVKADVPVKARTKTVRIVLLKDVKLKVIGSVTGRSYVFDGAGSACRVDERDLPKLLEKNTRGGCCGGPAISPYFEVGGTT